MLERTVQAGSWCTRCRFARLRRIAGLRVAKSWPTLSQRLALALVACLPPLAVAARPESGDGVVRFVYTDPGATSVYVVGDFNGWNPTATPLDREADGVWVAAVFIDPGTYEYKFLVDGEWRVDPDNPEVSESGNSVVRVGPGGTVLPTGGTTAGPAGDSTPGAPGSDPLQWHVRYLGFLTAREDGERYALEQPLHDVDLKLDVTFGEALTGWFLANFNNVEEPSALSRTSLRYDRGLVLWRPQAFDLHLLDNVGVSDWEDPGKLVGSVGIYDDMFGYGRRGVVARRSILGAPLEFLYADDSEPAPDSLPATALPELPALDPAATPRLARYVAADSDHDADALAFRFRAGREDAGVGFGYRLDRGAAPGRLAELELATDSLGVVARGREFESTETWDAWAVDLRLHPRIPLLVEYLSGAREARSQSVRILNEARVDTSGATQADFGPATESDESFELDDSRRVVVHVGKPGEARWKPHLYYEYQQNDFSALVTGTPFLMRHNGLGLELGGRAWGVRTRLAIEQHWFDYARGSSWETQFWFRQHNFWLDETKARYDRLALLGADRASRLRLELERQLWPRLGLHGTLLFTYASPGFDRAPRYLETVLRFALPLRYGFELRTHSRLATLRRFTTSDPLVVSQLGPGAHVEAGALAQRDLSDAAHDYRTFGAHFVELVYPLSERTDIALGFGVDPYVVYEVRNTYMDIGWDQFLFDAGASPEDAFRDPVGLGDRLEAAERALESERRLTLEARVNF